MDDRIHSYLDGELSFDELTPAERAEVDRFEAALRLTPDPAGSGAESLPDLAPAVMARIEEAAAAEADADPSTSWAGWLWTPRPISVRPVVALALAAGLALLAVPVIRDFAAPPDAGLPGGGAGAEGQAAEVFVHFRLDAPDAERVRLVGDFTEWEPTVELHEVSEGVWTAVVGVAPGVHDYAFVVDEGEWVIDPLALEVDDGFGGRNSRLSILPPGSASASGAGPQTL